jgi:uncharacterized protein (TIGR02996 family)
MTTLNSLLAAVPADQLAALAAADFLEEQGDRRGELLRLVWTATRAVEVPDRERIADRMSELLGQGVEPIGPYRELQLAPGIALTFAWVLPGTFLMGSPPGEEGREPYEGADERQHRVTLTKGFFLGVHAVTQEQWQAVMGSNPSRFKGETLPVEQVSWDDCREFCRKLSERDGQRYRLPTEAEWEYACRGGTTTPFHFGETISTQQANYNGNHTYGKGTKGQYRQKTTAVGTFPANAWGLFDMHGNVWEWCEDWFGPYPESEITDPKSPDKGTPRVLRGGSWYYAARGCRSAYRHHLVPACRYNFVGCRVVLCLD